MVLPLRLDIHGSMGGRVEPVEGSPNGQLIALGEE